MTLYRLERIGRRSPPQLGDQIIELIEGAKLTVGSHPDCDIVLESRRNRGSVSRQHAELKVSDGQLTLTDLKSRNGTFINGLGVSGDRLLKLGDEVSFTKSREFDYVVKAGSSVEMKASLLEVASPAPLTPYSERSSKDAILKTPKFNRMLLSPRLKSNADSNDEDFHRILFEAVECLIHADIAFPFCDLRRELSGSESKRVANYASSARDREAVLSVLGLTADVVERAKDTEILRICQNLGINGLSGDTRKALRDWLVESL